MGNIVDRNTLRAMLLEIFVKDKELFKEITGYLLKEDPTLLSQINALNFEAINTETQKEEISDEEFEYWIDKHFKKYDAVFKALA